MQTCPSYHNSRHFLPHLQICPADKKSHGQTHTELYLTQHHHHKDETLTATLPAEKESHGRTHTELYLTHRHHHKDEALKATLYLATHRKKKEIRRTR